MSRKLRLDRLLANLGYGSRRTVQNLINARQVTLDGNELTKGEAHIELSPDLTERMQIDGEPLDPLPGLTVLMHKPLGYTCSHQEDGDLVYDLLPERWQAREPKLSTVGRLDKDTTGLLLLTDDGALLHKLTSPKSHLAKRYRATLARPLRGNEAEVFASGTLMLEGEKKPLLPAQLEIHAPTEATVMITEGRYHQVRRMFAAVGNHVEALHRERLGNLVLPAELAPGEYLILSSTAVAEIFGQ